MREYIKEVIEDVEYFLKGYGADAMWELFLFRGAKHFLIGSFLIGLICGAVGMHFHWILGLGFFVLGIFLPALLLHISNKRDNEVILKDLKWLYETITVQLQSGLHIHQALQESEGLMANKRLRKALKRLTEKLLSGQAMDEVLSDFEQSFRNHYISSFCLILRQMQHSGYGVKLLEDIRIQMEEMERMQLKKKKEWLEMQLQLFQMLLFIGVLVLIMYGCILAAFQNLNHL